MISLKIGDTAPDFVLKNSEGEEISLSQYKGRRLVLYFYPKDATPGCTIEAQKFRNDYQKYIDIKTDIIGISIDDTKSHQKFKSKQKLPFNILSDKDKKVVKLYGVWKKKITGEGIQRATFLIDENQKILHIWNKVNVITHSKDILNILTNI